jgi:hypothetical protein
MGVAFADVMSRQKGISPNTYRSPFILISP